MMPREACCFTRDSGSAGLFLDISNEALAANKSDAIRQGRDRDKTATLDPVEDKDRDSREQPLETSSG